MKEMQRVLITDNNREFDTFLAEAFLREGFTVYTAGVNEPVDGIDLYIDVSDVRDGADSFTIRDGLDEKFIRSVYEKNVIAPMAMLEKYLPLLDTGSGKRLCYLTAAEASLNETRDINGYAYKLSKAAMHNFYQMTANKLTPNGYTFRFYDPMFGSVDPKASAEAAFNYFTRKRGTEHNDPLRDDETRWVFRDALGREHTW
jgi:NAD(P)-dependent dehydrogenase (short-subunit alcohol dehydrogenase family)